MIDFGTDIFIGVVLAVFAYLAITQLLWINDNSKDEE
jgi:hypothetical protein